MTAFAERLDNLQQLADKLAKVHVTKLEENQKLQQKVQFLQQQLDGSLREIELLKSELNNVRQAKAFSSGNEDSELAKAKISSLVREIDRCIALLNE